MMKVVQHLGLTLLACAVSFCAKSQAKLMLPVGHTTEIYDIAYSPDGKYNLTRAAHDNTALVWETSSGKLIHSLGGHSDAVSSAQYSPDGKYILTTVGGTAKIWDATSGKVVHTMVSHKGELTTPQWTPDGIHIITFAWDDKNIKIWHAASGKLLRTLQANGDIRSAQIIANGNYIMTTVAKGNTVQVWEVASGKLIRTLEHSGVIESVKVSPNGKHVVAIAAQSNEAKVWEITSGVQVCILRGYRATAFMQSAVYSPNGKTILTISSGDRTAKVWDATNGELLHMLIGHPNEIRSAQYNQDGSRIVTTSYYDYVVKIWDAESGKLLHSLAQGTGSSEHITTVSYGAAGKYLLTATGDDTVRVWDTASATMLYDLKTNPRLAKFSPAGEHLATVGMNSHVARIRNASSGEVIQSLTGRSHAVTATQYSPDGKFILSSSTDYNTTKVWDVSSGRLIHSLEGKFGQYSMDSKKILTTSNEKAFIWDASSGKMLRSLEQPGMWNSLFSPDGKYVATSSGSGGIIIWDWDTGKELHTLDGLAARYSTDGKFIITTTRDGAYVWDSATGKHVSSLEVGQLMLSSAARFSPNGKYAVASEYLAGVVAVCDASTGKTRYWLKGRSFDFSPDGKYIATAGNQDSLANIWDIATGKLRYKLKGHSKEIAGLQYSADGKYLITVGENSKIWDTSTGKIIRQIDTDGSIHVMDQAWTTMISEKNSKLSLHNIQTGNEILSWIRMDSTDWVVTAPSGLFDASQGAMDKLYFVQNLDVIEFSQLKERYYEPGLWKKVMTGEKLRNVTGMRSIELPPDIRVGAVDERGYLPIELTNRGGGIGEVVIYIQGKEVEKDARDKNADPDAPSLTINYYVGNHKNLTKGENFIAVKAWNKNHWVKSRGVMVSYIKSDDQQYQPAAHIVTIGVSDYMGGAEIDLTYAAKDAQDMNKAIGLGAARLFGTQKSYFYNLTTLQSHDQWPTKTNIIAAFEKISKVAHPLDVVVVYLSGHGISVGGAEGDWHYLTQEAYSINAAAYSDPGIAEKTTLSSSELVELFKAIPAAKQVLIIDACASGKVVDNLVTKKDIPSGTLRALDRMKDRVGLHIITGCTADAVSYEASKYGQGVLTYSLLEGIRGAALREEEFVDVNKLFHYAQERVPVLAVGIGGIQTPMIFSPQGSHSFDIGQLTNTDKNGIPISKIRPVYIQSNFQDEEEMSDILGLGKKVDNLLNESAAKGVNASLIFVPVREYPDGCQLVGRYRKANGKIVLKLKKKCEGQDKTVDIAEVDLDSLGKKIILVVESN